MDIFKLFFNHDQRLDKLAKRNANKTAAEKESSLDDFLTPDPTYSKFFITGTLLEDEEFGLNTLSKSDDVITQLNMAFPDRIIYNDEQVFSSLADGLQHIETGQALIIHQADKEKMSTQQLRIDEESNVGHRKEELSSILRTGACILYKEQAHHGYDLHLFSMENIYDELFEVLQPLVSDDFRFFSINSKRMGSERHFYFETWTLDRPPHGAEEVFAETTL